MNSTATRSGLASETLRRISEGLRHSETASITQIIELIETLTSHSGSISVETLAELISRDLTIMFKVIRLANTLAFNPEGIAVTTISQAIQVVGFDKIRNLAVSLLLLENAEGRHCTEESRGAAALALTSGLLAQALAEQRPGCDPEHAFVCASLRSYGRLLLTTFLPAEFREAEGLTALMPAADAYRQVLGLSPDQLGREFLAQARLPGQLLSHLDRVPPEVLSARAPSPADQQWMLAEFGFRLCELINLPQLTPANLNQEAIALSRAYSVVLSLDADGIANLLHEVRRRLQVFGATHGVHAFASDFMRRFQQVTGKPGEGPALADKGPAPSPTPVAEAELRQAFLRGMAEISELYSRGTIDEGRVFGVAAATFRQGLCLQDCWIFLEDDRQHKFRARIGHHPLFETLQDQPLLSADQRSVFNVCLTRGEAVMIQNPQDPKIAAFIPDWFRPVVNTNAFILLPIRDRHGTFALVYGNCGSSEALERLSAVKQELRLFCTHLALVRRLAAASRE